MDAEAVVSDRLAPGARASSVVSALFVVDHDHDAARVAIPGAEVHLVVRIGPSAIGGLDVHALGARERVHRKVIRGGQRVVMARLKLGATEKVLGVPASALAGRIVPLEDLWGEDPARRLTHRLATTRASNEAAAILESAIAERLAVNGEACAHAKLVLEAADRLISAHVNAVASDLGVSERHLRRVFHETIGVSPKAFARLMRFRRALRAARSDDQARWASIAADAGYYDQAHLIAEFRAITGSTPRSFLGELRAAPSVG